MVGGTPIVETYGNSSEANGSLIVPTKGAGLGGEALEGLVAALRSADPPGLSVQADGFRHCAPSLPAQYSPHIPSHRL